MDMTEADDALVRLARRVLHDAAFSVTRTSERLAECVLALSADLSEQHITSQVLKAQVAQLQKERDEARAEAQNDYKALWEVDYARAEAAEAERDALKEALAIAREALEALSALPDRCFLYDALPLAKGIAATLAKMQDMEAKAQ